MSGFEDFAFKYIRFILISTIVMLLIVSGEKIGLVIDKKQSSETQTYWWSEEARENTDYIWTISGDQQREQSALYNLL